MAESSDLHRPGFLFCPETERVVAWRSVYPLKSLTPVPITFVLTCGGNSVDIAIRLALTHSHSRVETRLTRGMSLALCSKVSNCRLAKPTQDYTTLDDAPSHYVLEK